MFKNKLIILILILILAIGAASFYLLRIVYFGDKELGKEQVFVIEKGEGVNVVSRNLAKENLIKNKFIFETYLWLRNLEGKLRAGEYRLKGGMSLRELVNILVIGKADNEREIKIIEGWTTGDIALYLEKEGVVIKDLFLEATKKYELRSMNYEFLKDEPKEATLEGFLFPDTYRIYRDAEAEDIIKKMLDNFDRKLTPEMRQDIKNSKRTIFEIITLASILEKEMPDDNDRAFAADIFYKRLRVGMPLQADSTVNYITGKKAAGISFEDKKINSPYNTYKYRGLPPGPISNPGLGAIKAVIYPIKNNYWYFLTTPDGKVIFSKTLEEHNRAKAKYWG